eukprot:CAMPEP_0179070642 /NCGR_PEP_ID=MMETSP0796-20121207/31120_1 /TAXON_ID=73915 /ORGANISM="Pyrodinium bahamense, Strain pbaha01" /LENGTH=377 /DNA_ID=CAMNT_0020767729 /DNA_START=585 /DNA_END=1719 /DNA_ORIENTATION=+
MGIRSLGAVLAQTKVMVMAWDSTYFSRLWCVYEISAFRAANPQARVDFVPVELGMFLAVLLAGSTLGLLAMGIFSSYDCRWFMLTKVAVPLDDMFGLREWQWLAIALYVVPVGFGALVVMCVFPKVRTYLHFRAKLQADLSAFTVQSAQCFCCDCGHVHPESGDTIPCDRDAIYASIRHWYTGSLDRFEASIRGDFKDQVDKMLGPLLPYSHAVCLGLPYFLAWLDCSRCCPSYVLLLGMVRLLLQAPLDVFVFLSVCRCLSCMDSAMSGRCCYHAVLPAWSILAVSSVAILEFAVDWILQWCRYSFVAWVIIMLVELGLARAAYASTWKLKTPATPRQNGSVTEFELPDLLAANEAADGVPSVDTRWHYLMLTERK